MASSAIGGQPQVADFLTPVAEPFDPEVVLPSRVDANLHRTYAAVERAVVAVDDKRRPDRSARCGPRTMGFDRSHKAVLHQVQAVPDPSRRRRARRVPTVPLPG